jgi:nucleoside-diphosphate-sugar epimerase
MTNTFIFGAGFSGLEIGKQLSAAGQVVAGTTRSADKFVKLAANGLEPFDFDGDWLSAALVARLQTVTHLVMSIGPDDGGDPLVPILGDHLSGALKNLQWIGYLSTVGVYGDHDGGWVNEETACKPVSQRSVQRLEAEKAWENFSANLGVPLAILRLSGIYGPGRNTFVNLANDTAKRIIKPNQVFNRIHVSDIARAVMHLSSKNIGGLFNVTDDEPAPPQDVVTYAANLMGVTPPEEIAYDDAQMSPMARSFYGEVKKVSNAKLRSTGFEFQYPNYRVAMDALWHEQNWKR